VGKGGETAEIEKALTKVRAQKDEISRKIGRVEGMIELIRRKTKEEGNIPKNTKMVSAYAVEDFVNEIQVHLEEAEENEDIFQIRVIISRARETISSFLEGLFSSAKLHRQGSELDDKELSKLKNEKTKYSNELNKLNKEESELNKNYINIKKKEEEETSLIRRQEKELYEAKEKRGKIANKLESLKFKEEKLNIENEDFKRELQEAKVLVGGEAVKYEKIKGKTDIDSRYSQEVMRKQIEKLKIRLEDIGPSNEALLKEYKEVSKRDEFLERELEDLKKTAKSLSSLISELEEKLNSQFKEGIKKINKEFQEFFKTLFGGGEASISIISAVKKPKEDLDLVSEDETLEIREEQDEEGIDIKVSIPRKRIRGLQMLSGGERALTSIALLFAMTQVSPPPFLVLDEIDAALDEANSRKYGDMIEELSKCSQLILITHNRETMSRTRVLYGVTMGGDGASKVLSVKFEDAIKIVE